MAATVNNEEDEICMLDFLHVCISKIKTEKTYCPSKIKITHAEKSLLPNTVPPHMRKN